MDWKKADTRLLSAFLGKLQGNRVTILVNFSDYF